MLAKRTVPASSQDDIFDSLFGSLSGRTQQQREHLREDGGTLEFDLPGVKPSDIDLTVEGSVVKLTYKRGQAVGNMSWQIHESYDMDNVTARLEHGVLSLNFPKTTKSRGRKIDVQTR